MNSKKVITLCLLVFTLLTNVYSQSTSTKISYLSNSMHVLATDKNNKEVTTIPLSNSVLIDYDTFYKSYTIVCMTDDGLANMKFSYVQTEPNGTIRMMDKDGNIHYVIDKLKESGSLKIRRAKIVNGLSSWYIIKDAVVDTRDYSGFK